MPTGYPKEMFKKECCSCSSLFFTRSTQQKNCNKCRLKKLFFVCDNCSKKKLKRPRQRNNFCNSCLSLEFKCKCGCEQIGIPLLRHISGGEYIHGHGRKNRATSEDHKRKISEANKGRPMNEDTKKRLLEANLGRKFTEEHRKKISDHHKANGVGTWMKGRKLSKETCEKLRKNSTGREFSKQTRDKISKANKGLNNGMFARGHSIESKQKISDSSKDMWKDEKIRASILNHPDRAKNSRYGALRAYEVLSEKGFYDTKPERDMEEILNKLQITYNHPYKIKDIEHFYYADFFIPEYNLIIETDGIYWHNYPTYRDIDLIRNKELKDKGYNLLRFWEGKFDLDLVSKEINNIRRRYEHEPMELHKESNRHQRKRRSRP
jgi:very-short-patch-repair endonuclease